MVGPDLTLEPATGHRNPTSA